MRATLTQSADDWQKLWALLCGLALMAPRAPADATKEPVRGRFPEFPAIKDPLETALAEVEKFVKRAADRAAQAGAIRALMVAKRTDRAQRTQTINQARALIITGPDDVRVLFTGQTPAELVAELAAPGRSSLSSPRACWHWSVPTRAPQW